jgi:hypothetical protein
MEGKRTRRMNKDSDVEDRDESHNGREEDTKGDKGEGLEEGHGGRQKLERCGSGGKRTRTAVRVCVIR